MRLRLTLLGVMATCLVAQAQTPVITGLVNPGTGQNGPISPGGQVNIVGTNLGDSTAVNCGAPVPTVCGGVSVSVNGAPVVVRAENAGQVTVFLPMTLTGTTATVQLSRVVGGATLQSAVFNATVAPTAPGLFTTNVNGVTLGNFQDASGAVFTPTAPAHAGDAVKAPGTGFGVTNPTFVPGSGVVPATPAYNVVAAVKVTVGGVNATVTSSTLFVNGIGAVDQVTFVLPAGLAGGNQPVVVNVGGVNSQTLQLPVEFTGPVVTSVVNSASNAVNGLPNAGVAPGSILVAYGTKLGPATLVTAPGYPWPETLSGTSAQITIGGVTTKLLFYYTSATQIAGLLPSSTPVGTGTITVTYNGQTGGPSPITVQPNNFGVYTVSQNGAGFGIVTFADYSLVTQTKAANPGETLIIWGTGLGAVTGNEAAGALPGDMTNLPVTVTVGGVPATVVYRGRSGCCVGEDQIVFQVPNVSGCNVPLAIQVRNNISNYSLMAVATTGRTCTPAFPVVTPPYTTIQQPKVLVAQLSRNVNPPPQFPGDVASNDRIEISPFKLGVTGAELNISQDGLTPGSCMVFVGNHDGNPDPPVVGLLDAGTTLVLKGPAGTTRTLTKSGFQYSATLGDTSPGNFLDSGAYTLTGTGGADIGAFIGAFTIPPFTWTNRPAVGSTLNISRSQGIAINWTGGDANGSVTITGGTNGANFACMVRGNAGTFTVPPSVLLALPAGGGGIAVQNSPAIQYFAAPGTDTGLVSMEINVAGVAQYQ
jgi:uncharacterized protein (TIGR03437 family)